jgi:hypothetical protein
MLTNMLPAGASNQANLGDSPAQRVLAAIFKTALELLAALPDWPIIVAGCVPVETLASFV